MKRLILMMGIPGSGKSTFIKNNEHLFSPSHQVISRDKIRFRILTDEDDYFSKEGQVWRNFIIEIKNSLFYNEDTIVDATHLNEASRNKLLKALELDSCFSESGIEKDIIFINTPLDIAIERNSHRLGREHVPEQTIRNMFNALTTPSIYGRV